MIAEYRLAVARRDFGAFEYVNGKETYRTTFFKAGTIVLICSIISSDFVNSITIFCNGAFFEHYYSGFDHVFTEL